MPTPRILKALTLHQPYASLVAVGAKTKETRGWVTQYRGPLAIHSGARPVTIEDLSQPGIATALLRHGVVPPGTALDRFHEYLPLGQVLCTVDVVGCHRTEIMIEAGEIQLTEEFYLGNYEPGRFAFALELDEVFKPGIPAKGMQGFWNFTFPDPTNKEPTMAKTPKPETEKPARAPKPPKAGMSEEQAKDEKGAVDAAFSAPATERPGVPTDPDFDGKPPTPEQPKPVTSMPEVPTYADAIQPDEFISQHQHIVFVKFSTEEKAVKADDMAACDREVEQMERDMGEVVKEWKEKIKIVEGKRRALSAQVSAKGEEKEITCGKRIDEKNQEVVFFNMQSMEIVERRKLNKNEVQTELQIQKTQSAAASTAKKGKGDNILTGNFPKDRVIGATAKENPAQDAKNDAAVKALAEAGKK